MDVILESGEAYKYDSELPDDSGGVGLLPGAEMDEELDGSAEMVIVETAGQYVSGAARASIRKEVARQQSDITTPKAHA